MCEKDMKIQEFSQVRDLQAIQNDIAKQVILRDLTANVSFFAGVDQAFYDDKVLSYAVVVNEDMSLVDEAAAVLKTAMPYVAGLLFYREGPAIIAAFRKLHKRPDVLFVDACGINHYRFAGLASHVGVILDLPTIGVSKRPLCGHHTAPASVGAHSVLRFHARPVGFVLKTGKDSRPIFISPGHRVSLKSSLDVVQRCLRGHKLPEPLRLAHAKVRALKRMLCATGELRSFS
jgi:deoxyribonuclease V